MRLHHFTSLNALAPIGKFGLTIGDVPTDIKRRKGVVGVWLTTASEPVALGLAGSAVDKSRVRLALDLPDDAYPLHSWDSWKRKNVDPDTVRRLEQVAGRTADPSTWYIYLGWLQEKLIVEAVDMATGTAIADWRGGLQGVKPVDGVAYRDKAAWHRDMLRRVRKATAWA